MLHWLWRSQNLSVQSIEPLMMRVSSNCRHVTASWWPWSVLIHSPLNVHTYHAHRHETYRHTTHYTLHNVHAALLSTQQPAYLYYHQSYHQSSCLLVPLVPLACSRKKPTLDVFLSPLLLPKSRTIYLLLSESHHHLTPSNTTSKLTTLPRYNILTT